MATATNMRDAGCLMYHQTLLVSGLPDASVCFRTASPVTFLRHSSLRPIVQALCLLCVRGSRFARLVATSFTLELFSRG